VEDTIESSRHPYFERNIVLDEAEARVSPQVLEVGPGTGNKVVHADHFVAIRQETVAQVGAQKACCSRDQNAQFASLW
jgi:hypothetical protein